MNINMKKKTMMKNYFKKLKVLTFQYLIKILTYSNFRCIFFKYFLPFMNRFIRSLFSIKTLFTLFFISNPDGQLMVFVYSLLPFLKDTTFIVLILYCLLIKLMYFIFGEISKYFDNRVIIFSKKYFKNNNEVKGNDNGNDNSGKNNIKKKDTLIYTANLVVLSEVTKKDMIIHGLDMENYESLLKKLEDSYNSKESRKFKNLLLSTDFSLMYEVHMEISRLKDQLEKRKRKA